MWEEKDNKLTKTFRFPDFRQAFVFMEQVAEVADTLDHHPWWSNSYNIVEFRLSTHDSGDIVTEKDHQLASEIDNIYNQLSSSAS